MYSNFHEIQIKLIIYFADVCLGGNTNGIKMQNYLKTEPQTKKKEKKRDFALKIFFFVFFQLMFFWSSLRYHFVSFQNWKNRKRKRNVFWQKDGDKNSFAFLSFCCRFLCQNQFVFTDGEIVFTSLFFPWIPCSWCESSKSMYNLKNNKQEQKKLT